MIVTRQAASNIRAQRTERVIFFDLETTGLNPYHSEIIEIAASDSMGNTFNKFLHVEHIPPFIQNLTHITPAMIQAEGVSQKKGLSQFLQFLNMYGTLYDVILVAHNNVSFDRRFLELKLKKYNLSAARNAGVDWTYLDSLHLSQLVLPNLRRHNMDALSNYFNVVNEQAHRAIGDVKCLQQIFTALQVLFVSQFHTKSLRQMQTVLAEGPPQL